MPRIKGQAEVMGVEIQVSELRDDGTITISVPKQKTLAATDSD